MSKLILNAKITLFSSLAILNINITEIVPIFKAFGNIFHTLCQIAIGGLTLIIFYRKNFKQKSK